MTILLFIIWNLYSFFEGFREGFYYNIVNRTSFTKTLNLHPFFSTQRGLVILLMFMLEFTHIGCVNSLLFCLCCSIAFPFIHDGTYYTTRHYLDKKLYENGWFSQSTSSTALMTKVFTPVIRTVLFIIGTICIFIL